MNTLPYHSLSPTITFYKYAQQTEVLSNVVSLAVTVAEAKEELPVYDDLSDAIIQRKIASAQRAVEEFLNKDTTVRLRRSLWLTPQRLIELPYGVHDIQLVEQQEFFDASFIETTDYHEVGLDFKSIRLEYMFPTRVTFISGNNNVEDIFKEAILQEVSYYFKNRNDPNETAPETVNGLSLVTQNLLANYRR